MNGKTSQMPLSSHIETSLKLFRALLVLRDDVRTSHTGVLYVSLCVVGQEDVHGRPLLSRHVKPFRHSLF